MQIALSLAYTLWFGEVHLDCNCETQPPRALISCIVQIPCIASRLPHARGHAQMVTKAHQVMNKSVMRDKVFGGTLLS